VRRATIPAIVIVVGILLLVDFLFVNDSLGQLAEAAVNAVILVAAGGAIAAVAALALRRAGDIWQRRGDPVGAALVLLGIGAMFVAGLRPGSSGTADPAVRWLIAALLVPIAATLFGLLFFTTIAAARRSVAGRGRQALVLVAATAVMLVLLLPFGGEAGDRLSAAASWALDVPIAAVLRGILLGVGILVAVVAARTMLGVGSADE
jgi:NO-binding membrane sensor protein with MHYT domain